MTVVHDRLWSPGWGGDSECLFDKTALGKVRGARACPNSKLCPLKNVGGVILDGTGLADTAYVRLALALLIEDPLRGDVCVMMRKLEETPDSGRFWKHLKYLVSTDVLWKDVHNEAACGGTYSAVYKDALFARAIFNLRYLNQFCNDKEVIFKLLGAAQLIAKLRAIDFSKGAYRIVHADVTNMYYQLRIGPLLSRCCGIRIGKDWFLPSVLPMGWKKACGIAQALMWGVILYCEAGEDRLGVPESALGGEAAPSHIDLDDGGMIVLVYDSVLIITSVDRAAKWHERLRINCDRVNMVLKYLIQEELEAELAYCGVGIKTTRAGLFWRLEESAVAIWKSMATQKLLHTPRTFFKFVGFLRFAGPVLNWTAHRLGEATKMQSKMGFINWKAGEGDIENVDEASISLLRSLVLSIENEWHHRKSHLPRKRAVVEVAFIAVDATPLRWAMWPMVNGKVVASECEEGSFESPTTIDVAEAWCLHKGTVYARSIQATVWVFANDNQGVGRSYTHGFSRSDGVHSVIKLSAIEPIQIIVMADVPTTVNVSDIGTRPEKDYTPAEVEYRRKQTWADMQTAYNKWKEDASAYHVRKLAGQAPDSLSSTPVLNSYRELNDHSLPVLDDENPE